MNKILLVLIALLAFVSAIGIRTSHDLWRLKPKINKFYVPLANTTWSYCDYKCLYLERYFRYDFVFITFNYIKPTAPITRPTPNFGACFYVKFDAFGTKSYSVWNTVATNKWYNTYCGKDTEDYWALSTRFNPKYQIVNIEGEGYGQEVIY
jgi:hypothetical protein